MEFAPLLIPALVIVSLALAIALKVRRLFGRREP